MLPRDFTDTRSDRARSREDRNRRIRQIDAELDWRTWARRRLAPYWYGLFALFLDVAGIATLMSLFARPMDPLAYLAAIAFLGPAVYLEWELYRIFWPTDDDLLADEARRTEPVVIPETLDESESADDRWRPPET